MQLEEAEYLGEAVHEYQAQATAHGHHLYPSLLLLKLVDIAFPGKDTWNRGNSNSITTALFFF